MEDFFPVDDLLDLSNDHLISSSTSSTDSMDLHQHHPPTPHHLHGTTTSLFTPATASTDFTNDLCVPGNWSGYRASSTTPSPTSPRRISPAPLPSKRTRRSCFPAGSKRSKWGSVPEPNNSPATPNGPKREPSEASPLPRRCTHCASEKMPQWRAGPMGPKTLYNACGVRYKSGRRVESDLRTNSALEFAPAGSRAPSPEGGFLAATIARATTATLSTSAAILSSPQRVSTLLTC